MSQPKDFRFSKTRSRAARRLSREDILDLVDLENGTICSSIFTDPDIYELEMEQIFRRTWQFLGHESQIPTHAGSLAHVGRFICGSAARRAMSSRAD